ncbi:uncharacterized protein LOC114268439 [Camellia sinensis]|uniref:uncharacterized protein LOC114268439 n=1 Tax=Camellia sinensis TaxID=4442 RepID=UPI0010357831|nr:uncharacterized protein LOC114268439 [Camellia sinensis]
MCKYSNSCAAIKISEGCCSGSHVGDVVVGEKRIVEVDGDNSCRIDSVICESSLVNDCDDFGGLLPSFYQEPERVLLSGSWKGIILSVGQEFEGGVPAFRIALAKYAIECGFVVNYLKNDATRVTAECNVHTCGVVARRSCSKMVGSRLVSDIVHNDISDNPLTRPIKVKKKLKKQYGVDISYRVAWLEIDKARGGLFGDFVTFFDQLRWYLKTAMRTNPGSVFELDVDEGSKCFQRLFVAFHGCLYGFQFCRPLLFVDGTFLKGRYKGHLLATTSKDGNQGLFPLNFMIVDVENQDNWMWFLSQLLKAVGSGRRLTFVSDHQHGLLDTLSKLRRIAGNGRVDSMLDGLQNDKWANAFFRGKRYSEMSSNAAESYNNWIGGARELPITCMVDMIRVQSMTQLSNRKAESKRWTTKLCPVMEKKMVDFLKLVKSWDVIVASDTVLEVHYSISFYVDIDCFRESYKESVYPVPSSERFDFDGAGSSIINPPITKKQPGRNKKKMIPSRGENMK